MKRGKVDVAALPGAVGRELDDRFQGATPLRRQDFRTGQRHKRGTLAVRVDLCVARHQRTGKPLVFVSGGLGKWPPAAVVC